MRKILFIALFFVFSAVGFAADLVATWEAPTLFSNGKAIPIGEPITYNLYYSSGSSDGVLSVNELQGIISDVSAGTYAIQVSAIIDNLESEKSDIVLITIGSITNEPSKITIQGFTLNCSEPCTLEIIQ